MESVLSTTTNAHKIQLMIKLIRMLKLNKKQKY